MLLETIARWGELLCGRAVELTDDNPRTHEDIQATEAVVIDEVDGIQLVGEPEIPGEGIWLELDGKRYLSVERVWIVYGAGTE